MVHQQYVLGLSQSRYITWYIKSV